jgi:hypothetical protein
MGKKLKVYRMTLMKPQTCALVGRQIRCVVAATGKKAAADALKVSAYSFNQYASEISEPKGVAVASSKPGAVFAKALDDFHGEYVEVKL